MEMTEEALNNERLQAAARFKAFMMKNSTKTNLNLYVYHSYYFIKLLLLIY